MAAKGLNRFVDNINRIFKNEGSEFGGDEKLQRQYCECLAINSGLTGVSKTIQANQVYEKISLDAADIDRKYESVRQKYPNYKIAQALNTAASTLNTTVNPEPPATNGTSHSQAASSPLHESARTPEDIGALHPISVMFREMAKELELMAKQQFSVENEVNATVLTELGLFGNKFDGICTNLKTLQKHCVDVSTTEKSLDDAQNKIYKVDVNSENFAQVNAKLQGKLEAVQTQHKMNCDRVESDRDLLRASVKGFVKDETDIANLMIRYVSLYKNYHSMCTEILSRLLPELEKCRDKSALSGPFDVAIEDHLSETKRDIAIPIELSTSWLHLNNALADHGLFRVGGNIKAVRNLAEKIDRFQAKEEDFTEASTMTTLLKQYLRALPESLFTQVGLVKLKDAYMKLNSKDASEEEYVAKYTDIIRSLPKLNQDNLKYIFAVLNGVLKHEEVNKMSADNIGTCIGPSFDPTKLDLGEPGSDFTKCDLHHTFNHVVAGVVKHAEAIFDLKNNPVQFRPIRDILEFPPIPRFNRSAGLPVSSTSVSSPLPKKSSMGTGGNHRRVKSSDKDLTLSGTSSGAQSSNCPTPPKPLHPDVSKKKAAPRVPSVVTKPTHHDSSFQQSSNFRSESGDANSSSTSTSKGTSQSAENLTSNDPETSESPKQYAFSSVARPKPAPRTLPKHSNSHNKGDNRVRPSVAPPPPPAEGSSPVDTEGVGDRESTNEEEGEKVPSEHSPRFGYVYSESTHL